MSVFLKTCGGVVCETVCIWELIGGILMVFLRGYIFQKPFYRGNQGRCFGSPLLVIGIDC